MHYNCIILPWMVIAGQSGKIKSKAPLQWAQKILEQTLLMAQIEIGKKHAIDMAYYKT